MIRGNGHETHVYYRMAIPFYFFICLMVSMQPVNMIVGDEALYDRFNSELSKLAKDVRAGSTEDALKTQLSGALEEIGRLKKENFRLKREVGGLRAQQAAVALLKASE